MYLLQVYVSAGVLFPGKCADCTVQSYLKVINAQRLKTGPRHLLWDTRKAWGGDSSKYDGVGGGGVICVSFFHINSSKKHDTDFFFKSKKKCSAQQETNITCNDDPAAMRTLVSSTMRNVSSTRGRGMLSPKNTTLG